MISVIVPVYNIKDYISHCLDSLLAQSFRDFEVICVDDGSADGSERILDDYASKDARIKVIHQANSGQSAARNNGLKAARGGYIAFVDGDDAVTPEYLETLHAEAVRSNADLVACDIRQMSAAGTNVPSKCVSHQVKNFSGAVAKSYFAGQISIKVSACAKLFRRDFLPPDPFVTGIYYEDYLFFLTKCLMRFQSLSVISAPMYLYTQVPSSIMHSPFNRKKCDSYVFIRNEIADYAATLDNSCFRKKLRRKADGHIVRQLLNKMKIAFAAGDRQLAEYIAEQLCNWRQNHSLYMKAFKLRHRILIYALCRFPACRQIMLKKLL